MTSKKHKKINLNGHVAKKMSRGKRWCFTINNYTETDVARCERIDCDYIVFGKEVGEEEHTPHLQGFVVFKNRKTFNAVKKIIGENAHIEIARGTIKEASDYCKKDGNYYEKGQLPEEQQTRGGQATKRKWEEALNNAKQGKFDDIPPDIYIRYRNSLKAIYQEEVNKNTVEIMDAELKGHFVWIYGPTGTGKSHLARSLAMSIDPDTPPYLKGLNKWWSGYKMQKVVIIEEASPEACKYLAPLFKQWCDKWPFTAETKGGTFENGIRPPYIFVTSNYSIKECFPDPNDHEPMLRRMWEFYKETKETWIPLTDYEEEHDTQVLPVEPAIEGLTSTQIDISEPEDEPVLKVAEPI